jgi:hypothetical protein
MFEFNPTNLPRARNEATYSKVASDALPDIFYMFGGNYFPSLTTTLIPECVARWRSRFFLGRGRSLCFCHADFGPSMPLRASGPIILVLRCK